VILTVVVVAVGKSRLVDAKIGSRCSSGTVFLRDIGLLAGGLLPFRPAVCLGKLAMDNLVKFGMLFWPCYFP